MTSARATEFIGDSVSVLLLGAGSGTRFGISKALQTVNSVTMLERSVQLFSKSADQIVVGVRSDDFVRANELVGAQAEVVVGGLTRQETFANLLRSANGEILLIHDVARPVVSESLVTSVLQMAYDHGAAAPVLHASTGDSMALADSDSVWLGEALPRERVIWIQTPYAFRRKLLLHALELADVNGWQETSITTLVRRAGYPVRLVPGDPNNLKITVPDDLVRVEQYLDQSSI